MTYAVSSVIVAAAQAVTKVFFIGVIGWGATRFPADRPLLPVAVVPVVARFSFHVLVLALVFSTTAKSVNIDTIGNYWSLIVGAFYVLGVSYLSASGLALILLRRKSIHSHVDVGALNVAATFPNILAMTILIFPSLCEFETMIFCSFFSWSLAFWTFGYPKLLASANAFVQSTRGDDEDPTEDSEVVSDAKSVSSSLLSRTADIGGYMIAGQNLSSIWAFGYPQILATTQHTDNRTGNKTEDPSSSPTANNRPKVHGVAQAIKTTLTSPGFIALAAGMIVGCIPKVPDLLFVPGGWLRWLGDGLETLGSASSSLSTMIVAASLAPKREPPVIEDSLLDCDDDEKSAVKVTLSDRMRRLWQTMKSDETAVLTWFILSRLLIAPAIVVGTVAVLRCRLIDFFPPLALLVMIINSCLPGALIVVVLLKSAPELEKTATEVAKVYLPSYLLSIVTIAAWTAIGLWLTLPDVETGKYPSCER